MTVAYLHQADIAAVLNHVRFLGVKRTSRFNHVTSAYDPKRTWNSSCGFRAHVASRRRLTLLEVAERRDNLNNLGQVSKYRHR